MRQILFLRHSLAEISRRGVQVTARELGASAPRQQLRGLVRHGSRACEVGQRPGELAVGQVRVAQAFERTPVERRPLHRGFCTLDALRRLALGGQ